MDFDTVRNDFEVHYRFLSEAEGGRKTGPPYQGYRCDWLYQEDDINPSGKLQVYMIWPIFVDKNGIPLREGTRVATEGSARMTILNDDLRQSVHRRRLNLGIEGYFTEGAKRVAKARVTKLVDLLNDENQS